MNATTLMKSKFPNLFIIGAMKAGTSSLHEYLHQHPEIFMARYKEPMYFAPHRTFSGAWGEGGTLPEAGIGWYLRLFEDAGHVKYAGESSTNYTKDPVITGCAERIHRFNPDARLIYIMRDPIERTISHYWWQIAGLEESRSLLTAIRRDAQYLAYSHYARQLVPYVRRFGRDRIFALTLEELTAQPDRTFRSLFEWLGVDPEFVPRVERHNAGKEDLLRLRGGLQWIARCRNHWRWKRVEQQIPNRIRCAIRGITCTRVDRRACDLEPAKTLLRNVQREQTAELAALLGRDFPEWTTLYADSAARSDRMLLESVDAT